MSQRECDDRNLPKIRIQHASKLGCRQRLHNILWPAILTVVITLGGLGFCCILFPGLYIFVLHQIHQSEENEKDEADVTDLDSDDNREEEEEDGEKENKNLKSSGSRAKHRPPPLDLSETKWVLAPTTTVWVDSDRPPGSADAAVQACRPSPGALDRLTLLAEDLAYVGGTERPRQNHVTKVA